MAFETSAAVVKTAQYSTELLRDCYGVPGLIRNLRFAPITEEFLHDQSALNVVGMGLLTKQIYDIAHVDDQPDPNIRQEAALLGGLTLLLSDIVDDQIDDGRVPLEEKCAYLDNVNAHLLYGNSYDHESSPLALTVYELTDFLHGKLTSYKGETRYEGFMNVLVDAIKEQFVSHDLEKQLELVKLVGAKCGEIAVAAVEIVDDREYPDIKEASQHIGAYTQCIDNAYEIDEDMGEGSLAYATLFVHKYGNERSVHNKARSTLVDLARSEYQKGEQLLMPKQQTIYKSAQLLLASKYKIYSRIKGHMPHRKGARHSQEAQAAYA